jgi:NAD(P) transhydrogenase subunit beta
MDLVDIKELMQLSSGVLFIFAIRCLSSIASSKTGIILAVIGMLVAISSTFIGRQFHLIEYATYAIVAGGAIGYAIARRASMISLPQLIAAFHSLVGLSAVLIDCSIFVSPGSFGIDEHSVQLLNLIEMSVGASVGAITFTGSIVAFCKLSGFRCVLPKIFQKNQMASLVAAACILFAIVHFAIYRSSISFFINIIASLAIGYNLVSKIGGADMPVIVSMLNSYSGWAAVGIGLTLNNQLLIVVGSLVGASGAILSNMMCKGMNRSLLSVIFGTTGGEKAESDKKDSNGTVRSCSPEDAAFIVNSAGSVIIVPGYGMAVSQSQHVIRDLADSIKSKGGSVKYAIHPVAGRMPGHMNVLLAEANISHEEVFEIDEINHEFAATDVAVVIGANDITNPAAKTDPSSPIYGMPILEVENARTVLFIKRSLESGYAGVSNPLFYRENVMMVFGDAKKVCEEMLKIMKM